MDFFDNYYRKYLGLSLIEDSNICKVFSDDTIKYYVYFNNNKMKKILKISFANDFMIFHEKDVDYETNDDKTMLLPKTSKGKVKKITTSLLDSLNGIGTYFSLYKSKGEEGHFVIGNYTTQRSYYEGRVLEDFFTEKQLIKWLDKYVEETSDEDLLEIKKFSTDSRKHIKYKEGDYFRVKLGRHEYGYGRILMDITKRQKMGIDYWNILMGKPLIIEMFHILTKDKNIPISKLENLPSFPSQHIMDNNFYYGDYEIIGNGDLPSDIRYPIMYGRSISALDRNKVIFQCGEIHKEIEYNNNLISCDDANHINNFKNNGIGYSIDLNEEIIKECLKSNTNKPFWDYYKTKKKFDLRSPVNKEYLLEVLKQFDLEYLYKLYINQ